MLLPPGELAFKPKSMQKSPPHLSLLLYHPTPSLSSPTHYSSPPVVCRASLDSAHASASQLRVELDNLRSEILNYEDAILNARREIENSKREKREVELNYALVREEFDMQIHKLMQARRDAEESEHDLRARLTKSDSENVDLVERLNQLRQLEDEFNKKEQMIEELLTQNRQWERQCTLWEACRGKKTSSSITSPTSTASTPPTSAMISLLSSPAPPTSPSDLIPAELFDAVKAYAAQQAKTEQRVSQLEAENRDQKVRLAEASRSIQSLILQLDRSTNVHADLNHAMKSMEAQYMDECVKVEHSLKTIHLLQKQKKDQQTLLIGYEERMKHFQQLLTAADVRADSANTFLSELLRGWNVLKYGNRQMNEVVKRMRGEYRKMRKERNDAFVELHEKINKASTSSPASSSTLPDVDDKQRALDGHFRAVMEENTSLHVELDEERAKVERLEEELKNCVTKSKYDEDMQALYVELDGMRRFVKGAEERGKRGEEEVKEEREKREVAERENERLKKEKAEKGEGEKKKEEVKEGVKGEGEGGGEEERERKKRKLEVEVEEKVKVEEQEKNGEEKKEGEREDVTMELEGEKKEKEPQKTEVKGNGNAVSSPTPPPPPPPPSSSVPRENMKL